MKLILEKEEVVRILGQHFEAALDPSKVVIRTDPHFEIELTGIPLPSSQPQPANPSYGQAIEPALSNVVALAPAMSKESAVDESAVLKRADDNASLEPPAPGLDDSELGEAGDIHPAALMAKSQELMQQLSRENPQLTRQRKGGSSKAPTDYKDEL